MDAKEMDVRRLERRTSSMSTMHSRIPTLFIEVVVEVIDFLAPILHQSMNLAIPFAILATTESVDID
ncbi:MAG: hypothetical protein AAFR24_22840, partial [Cyanobacteria bacterium J06627_3]